MAEITGDEDVQEIRQKKANRHDGGVADLERVTDYAEEKEIQFNMSNVSMTRATVNPSVLRPASKSQFVPFRLPICLGRSTQRLPRSDKPNSWSCKRSR